MKFTVDPPSTTFLKHLRTQLYMADGRGRNEGAVDLSYQPPGEFKKLRSTDDEAVESGFEWSNINDNPDLDIWAVRVPANFKASDLAGVKIKLPSNTTGDVTGKLKKGGTNFVLHTVGGNDTFGAGEEMQNIRCMVPKAGENGALYVVPRPIKHLVLTQQEPIPAPTVAPAPPAQPTRRPQPVDRLKHSFAPIGALPPSPPRSSSSKPMEIDPAPAEVPKKKRKKQAVAVEVEAETPKGKSKAKKADKATTPDKSMEIDDAVPVVQKKSKKSGTVAEPPVEPSVKKEKKRKAASDD
ncbi:hypothetical protein FRC08_002248 [Ceratobasidium sp. 394]|nr:hypothetical protein FRC08_002248 [Ceratobasidium sp. 394]